MSTKLIVAPQKILCSNSPVTDEAGEKVVTLRMPLSLVGELDDIAEETSRSRSKAIILLLRRGIEAYHRDGVLLDTRIKDEQEELATYASLIEILKGKKEQATSRDKKAFIDEVIKLVENQKGSEDQKRSEGPEANSK